MIKQILDVAHSIADAIHDISPRVYGVLKEVAVIRHEIYKEIVERDHRPIEQTWHGEIIKKVYDK